jgi:hypothetical protein
VSIPAAAVRRQDTSGGSAAAPNGGGTDVKYLALIYGSSESWESMSSEEQEAMRDQYRAFAEDADRRGVLVGGFELEPASTATTLRSSDNGPMVTDGPFAETKEQLGGYFLLECPSLDDAIELASKIPAAQHGGAVEVRPVSER